jgi:hypothetical protein
MAKWTGVLLDFGNEMKVARVIVALLIVAVAPVVTVWAADHPRYVPNTEVLTFDPLSRAWADLGEIRLSSNFAAFAGLRGHMELEFVGQMQNFPAYPDLSDEISEGEVYRVVNAEAFFRSNPSLCTMPIKFVAAKLYQTPHRSGGGSTVSGYVWLLETEDYRDYEPTRHGLCGVFFAEAHKQ